MYSRETQGMRSISAPKHAFRHIHNRRCAVIRIRGSTRARIRDDRAVTWPPRSLGAGMVIAKASILKFLGPKRLFVVLQLLDDLPLWSLAQVVLYSVGRIPYSDYRCRLPTLSKPYHYYHAMQYTVAHGPRSILSQGS